MKNLKIYFLLIIFNLTFLIGTASAQWWVQGGNLLWPYGDVSVSNTFNADSIAANKASFNNITVLGTLNVLTDSLPNYPNYTAYLSQELTSDPIAVVLENTLGIEITWTRNSTGRYTGGFSSQIDDPNKLFIITNTICKSLSDSDVHPITFSITNTDITIRQDVDDLPGWLGATIDINGTIYYPIKIIKY